MEEKLNEIRILLYGLIVVVMALGFGVVVGILYAEESGFGVVIIGGITGTIIGVLFICLLREMRVLFS